MTCVAVLHDLNLVAAYCHDVLVLDQAGWLLRGRQGCTPDLVTQSTMCASQTFEHPITGPRYSPEPMVILQMHLTVGEGFYCAGAAFSLAFWPSW